MPITTNDIDALAAMAEPIRRKLYSWVVAQGRPVGRDEAANAVGISRALAAFHLDRLVREGLLEPEYRRLTGRTGPGAGRPAKLYRRSEREVAVSLPERRYDVAAGLMAEALEAIGEGGPPAELREAAVRAGREVGVAARDRAGARSNRSRRRETLIEVLDERGYEPRQTDTGEIRLGNCPFHRLVDDHRDLVCGMNVALAEGVLDGLGDEGLEARLDPRPGLCCVAIGPAHTRPASSFRPDAPVSR